MRLASVEVIPVRLPLPRAYVMNHDWTMDSAHVVLVRVRDAEGIAGVGYSVMYNERFHHPVTVMTRALAALLEGAEIDSAQEQWNRLRSNLAQVGASGIASLGLGAIDVALWDLIARRAQQPLFRLLGAESGRVDVYASATYFFQRPSDEAYIETAAELIGRGFTALKIDFPQRSVGWKVGVERVRRMRDALGDDVGLMVDCTQGWTTPEVIEFGRELEPFNMIWIEDPIDESDQDGHEEIAAALRTPIATGEWAFSVGPLQSWLARRSTDILIADVIRIGGLTPWKAVADTAGEAGIPLASHLYSEVSQHALAAAPTGLLLEYSDWTFGLLSNPPVVVDGAIEAPDAPGLGVDVDESALQRYRCD